MFFSRIHRRFTTGLALFALVMSALAPTVSQAVVMSSDRGDWLEVCTTTGVMWVKADAAANHDEPVPLAGHEQGCGVCTHTVTGAPPASAALSVSAIDQPSRLFQARCAPAHPAPFWAMAQSRAPPLYA